MYLLDYSLNNLSLMALTIATGFIVDDAIVVVENVVRLHGERASAARAALTRRAPGRSRRCSSMTLSLVAVFLPIMFMGGIIGRMMREFAVTLSVAILVSLDSVGHGDADAVLAPPARAMPGRRGFFLLRWSERGL